MYKHFDRNLGDLISEAATNDCPVILSTVGVNLLDSPPFASQESDHANAQYQLGLDHVQAGRPVEALAALKQARDRDGLRFRADSNLNAVIRDQAVKLDGQVSLVDCEKLFEGGDSGTLSIPGDDYFYDHVHLSFAGNFLVAKALAEALVAQLGPSPSFAPSRERVASALVYTEWDQLQIIRPLTEQLLSKPPFTNQIKHREKQLARQRQVRKLTAKLTPDSLEKTRELYESAVEKQPDEYLKRNMSQLLADMGSPEKAMELLRSIVRDFPKHIEAYNQLSLIALRQEDYAEAERSIQKILNLNPYAIEARNDYLLMLFNSRRFEEAERYCQRLMDDHPGDPGFPYVFAEILNAQAKGRDAIEQLSTVLQIDPKHAQSHRLLIQIHQGRNDGSKALQVAHAWTLADPESAEAQNEKAQLLAQQKDFEAALAALSKGYGPGSRFGDRPIQLFQNHGGYGTPAGSDPIHERSAATRSGDPRRPLPAGIGFGCGWSKNGSG